MSKEKSLGQVAFEADRSDFMGEFKDLPAYLKTNEETKAKAVIDEFLRRNGAPHKELLDELLAVIHKDGGYHQASVGIEQATKDAIEKVCQLQSKP